MPSSASGISMAFSEYFRWLVRRHDKQGFTYGDCVGQPWQRLVMTTLRHLTAECDGDVIGL